MATNNPPYDAQASTNYKEAFALFDKRGTQRVQVDSLGDLLRACGQNPTLAEIRDLEKGVGGECTFVPKTPSSTPLSIRKSEEWIEKTGKRDTGLIIDS